MYFIARTVKISYTICECIEHILTWEAHMEILKLPVGIENFKDIRRSGFYYIDKTMFIEQFLNTWSEVTLFTRPRRFGNS